MEKNTNPKSIASKSILASEIYLYEDYITCMICLEIVQQPQECEICHKVFCYNCLTYWLKTTNFKCPLKCKSKIVPADPIINDILSSLQYYCKNKIYGCQKVFYSDQLEKHITACNYEKVLCPNNFCSHQTIKVNLAKHLMKCNFQKICPFCKKVINLKRFPFHRKICQLREVRCKFCDIIYTFNDYEKHRISCREKYVKKINELKNSKTFCENCFNSYGDIVSVKLESIKECHICKIMYCKRCDNSTNFIRCNGCSDITCQSHMIKCFLCIEYKCRDCLKRCSNCKRSGICDGCLYVDAENKTFCKNCRKCESCKEISSISLEKKCFYCNDILFCENCITQSSISQKLICKNKCIYCNRCEYKFHDLELINFILILKTFLKKFKLNKLTGNVLRYIICLHTYNTYKSLIQKSSFI